MLLSWSLLQFFYLEFWFVFGASCWTNSRRYHMALYWWMVQEEPTEVESWEGLLPGLSLRHDVPVSIISMTSLWFRDRVIWDFRSRGIRLKEKGFFFLVYRRKVSGTFSNFLFFKNFILFCLFFTLNNYLNQEWLASCQF